MKGFTMILLVFLSLCVKAQQEVGEALQNRLTSIMGLIGNTEDAIELGLLINDLVYNTTLLVQRVDQSSERLENMQKVLHNPKMQKYLGSTQKMDLLMRIEYNSMNVRLYGRAIRGFLTTLSKALDNYTKAAKDRMSVDTGVDDIQRATKEAVFKEVLQALKDNPYTAYLGMGSGADMTPVRDQIDESNKKASAIERMKAWKAIIENFNDDVISLNNVVLRQINDIDLFSRHLGAVIGLNMMMMMNTGEDVVRKVESNTIKK